MDPAALAVWTGEGRRIPGGHYVLKLGASSADIRLEAELELPGEALPEPPEAPDWYLSPQGAPDTGAYERLTGLLRPSRAPGRKSSTMESTLLDLCAFSPAARALRAAMDLVIARANGGDRRSAAYRMMYSSAADASLSGMQINGGIRGPWLRLLLRLAKLGL